MRFVFSRPFIHTAITGMFDEQWLEDNYKALETYKQQSADQRSLLNAAGELARATGPGWLPPHYRWLDEEWRG